MPNWCENKLVITGDKDVVAEIIAKAKSTENSDVFSFSAFDPLPTHLDGNKPISERNPEGFTKALAGDQDFEYDNWYDWQIAHWGTKWDCNSPHLLYDVEFSYDGNKRQVAYYYNTAWSPGVQFAITLSGLYPVEVANYYAEEGMCFAGKAVAIGGELVSDDYINELSLADYAKAGATLTADGTAVDWDADQDYDLLALFD